METMVLSFHWLLRALGLAAITYNHLPRVGRDTDRQTGTRVVTRGGILTGIGNFKEYAAL